MLQAAYRASRAKRPLLQEQAALIVSRTVTALSNAVSYQPAQATKPDSVDGFFSPSTPTSAKTQRKRVALEPPQVNLPPKASTSQLVESPATTDAVCLSRHHRRVLRQLRVVTDIIHTMPAAHVSPKQGLVLVYPHIVKLQARMQARQDDLQQMPPDALEQLHKGAAKYASYLGKRILPNMHLVSPLKLQSAWQTGATLLHFCHVQLGGNAPKNLQALASNEIQVKRIIDEAALSTKKLKTVSIAQLSELEAILEKLRSIPSQDWDSLDAASLLHMWRLLNDGSGLDTRNLQRLGEAMWARENESRTRRSGGKGVVTKVWTLHEVLYLDALQHSDPQMPDGVSLASSEVRSYRALTYLLSKSVLALSKADASDLDMVEKLSAICLSQVQAFLQLNYPWNRQTTAAILHLHHVGSDLVRADLHKRTALVQAWRGWSRQQLDHSRSVSDAIMLVGFMRTISPDTSIHPSKADGSWEKESISQAAIMLGFDGAEAVGSDSVLAESGLKIKQANDTSKRRSTSPGAKVTSDLLRASAVASLRHDRIDIALDCLHDSRLSSRHAISVLHGLSHYLGPDSTIPVPERKGLVAILANFAARFASHIRTYIEQERVQHLVPFIELLSYHLHHDEAAALVLALQNPAHIGEAVLAEFLRKLSFHRQGLLALAIYRKIPPFEVTDYHRAALLSSPWKGLSDIVWEELFEGGKRDHLDVRLLNARLLHYANQPVKTNVSSRRILLDHSDAINVLGAEPTTETDNILFGVLIKAGKLRYAYDVYERLRKAASAHTSLLLNHFLVAAPKPRPDWRSIGPVAQHNRVVKALKQMTGEHDMPMNGVTANILLSANLKWGEMSKEAVWAALRAGLVDADKRDWATELRPLFRMVVRFFIKRGMKEDARKAVIMMAELRRSRIGR